MPPLHVSVHFLAGGTPAVSQASFDALRVVVERNTPASARHRVDEFVHRVLSLAVYAMADLEVVCQEFDCGERVYFTFADDDDDSEHWSKLVAGLENQRRFKESAWLN